MRQKNKQQAKIEATQKLEQVKNEQLQQQQQLKSVQTDPETPGNLQSPTSSHSSNGNMSPAPPGPKNGPAKPGDDVFLRPPPPPPSSGSQSPPMFSPGSSGSRPSSPWDPYCKMVGTPRPPTLPVPGKSPRSLMDEHTPGPDPYAKPPSTPRPAVHPDPFLKPMCPPRASSLGSPGHDPLSRAGMYQRLPQGKMILSDPYTRPLLAPIPGSNESGSVQIFKTPMPPPQTQESANAILNRRTICDPFERPMVPPRPVESFHPGTNDPYANPPLTPHPGKNDNFENHSRMARQPHSFCQPGTVTHAFSRPDFSTYSNPYARMPGTPRPHDPEPYSRQSASMNPPSRQAQAMPADPYAHAPGTPRPGMVHNSPDSFSTSDPYQSRAPHHARLPPQDAFSPPRVLMQDAFGVVPGAHTPRRLGDETPVHDPFETMPGAPAAQHQEVQTVPLLEAEERMKQVRPPSLE